MLEISNAHKTFHPGTPNEVRALQGVDLSLEDGSFTIVIGTNGSGKSTLLNAVAGTFFVDQGRLKIADADVTRWPEHQRASLIGRVFQNPFSGTAPNLTIAENLSLAALRGLPRGLGPAVRSRAKTEMREVVRQLNMGLEDRLDNAIGSLSGGQRQALTLLMATWRKPKLLLLDEHTAALDPKSADQVIALSERVIARDRLTALMVTHSMQQAAALGDRLIMMHRGKVIHDLRGKEKNARAPPSCWSASKSCAAPSCSTNRRRQCWSSFMFKRLWLGFTLILAASAFLLSSDWNQRTSAKHSMPRIAILQYSSLETLDAGARGLMDELKARGYENGHNALIDRFNAENDAATANSMAREMVSGKYDYAFTISTNCLQALANANRDGRVKHVFGVVADPVAAKVGINPKDPLDHPKHLVGIGSLLPVDELMAIGKRMNPRLQRFGVPWNPSQANSQKFLEMAREEAAKLKVELLEGSVDNTAAVGEVTASLIGRGADAILIVGDVTVGLGIDAAISEARKGRIPVLSVLPEAVARGVMVAMGADFYTVGREMGELCARVIAGEDMARMPILYSIPKQFAFNLTVPPTLRDRWVIPEDLLAKARVVIRK